jgi:histidine kinase-like protein
VTALNASRSIRVEAHVERLAEVRAFVRDAVDTYGGSRRAAEDLVRDGRIEIRILDRAPVFDPTAIPDPATATRLPRRPGTAGVGLQLARTMTDAVRHHVRPGGGNELTLVRSIEDHPAEEG